MDLTPLLGLRLRTDRLELRLPDAGEILALGRLAEGGIHDPGEMPFLVPWTDRVGEPDFLEGFAEYHHGSRERWRPDEWSLDLGVWADGDTLIGTQGLMATDFATRRAVGTGSWLAQGFQRRGYGTEMRAAVLELAFHGLGATEATSGALAGNSASLRVSQKLGYVEAGEAWPEIRGIPTREQILRLTRDRWIDRERISVRMSGLEKCFPLFGLIGPPVLPGPSC